MELLGSCLRSKRWKPRGSSWKTASLYTRRLLLPKISHKVPSQRHRENCRCLQLTTIDTSTKAHVEYNIKLELSLITRVLRDSPGSWSYHRKEQTLSDIFYSITRYWISVNGKSTTTHIWRRIYLNRDTLQSLMYTTPKMNAFKASCFT